MPECGIASPYQRSAVQVIDAPWRCDLAIGVEAESEKPFGCCVICVFFLDFRQVVGDRPDEDPSDALFRLHFGKAVLCIRLAGVDGEPERLLGSRLPGSEAGVTGRTWRTTLRGGAPRCVPPAPGAVHRACAQGRAPTAPPGGAHQAGAR
jgi:hypothetical protein